MQLGIDTFVPRTERPNLQMLDVVEEGEEVFIRRGADFGQHVEGTPNHKALQFR